MGQEGTHNDRKYHSASLPADGLHFITGATSLLGSEYLYSLLSESPNARCALLIHAKKHRSAEIKLNDLLHHLFGDGNEFQTMRKRIDVYAGDIRAKRFGLNDTEWTKLCRSVNYIFHAAANTNLSDSEENLNAVNVTGTVSVVHLAKQCPNLVRMLHVSTAYVSGTKTGLITPDELDMEYPASDDYQRSKRVAEKLVRKHSVSLPVVILRPSTLVGHSKLGRTHSYKAFYFPTRMLLAGQRVIYPASKQGKIEVVPADWAANVALKLLRKPGIEGRCFHLSLGDRAYSIDQVKRIIHKSLSKQEAGNIRLVTVPRALYSFLVAPLIAILYPNGRSINRNFRLLSHYTCIDRIYENQDTFRASAGDRHQLPGLESYYDVLCDYAQKNHWQRSRAPSALRKLTSN